MSESIQSGSGISSKVETSIKNVSPVKSEKQELIKEKYNSPTMTNPQTLKGNNKIVPPSSALKRSVLNNLIPTTACTQLPVVKI